MMGRRIRVRRLKFAAKRWSSFFCALFLLFVLYQGDVQSTGIFVASVNSDVFHISTCSYVDQIKESNKIWFSSAEEAIESGRRGCSRCNPEAYADSEATAPKSIYSNEELAEMRWEWIKEQSKREIEQARQKGREQTEINREKRERQDNNEVAITGTEETDAPEVTALTETAVSTSLDTEVEAQESDEQVIYILFPAGIAVGVLVTIICIKVKRK